MPRRNRRKTIYRPLPFSLTGGIVVRMYPPMAPDDHRPGVVVAEAEWVPPLAEQIGGISDEILWQSRVRIYP